MENTVALNLTGEILFGVTLPKMPTSINTDLMSVQEIHLKF